MRLITIFIAAVWLVNGLFCKMLGLVPRHQQIISRVLGSKDASLFSILIGVAEIAMAIWVVSGLFRKANAIVQIVIIFSMNVIEVAVAPDLLLWGYWNLLFAMLFILLIYTNAFCFTNRGVEKNVKLP